MDKNILDALYSPKFLRAYAKLTELIKALKGHEASDGHDGRYYTETETDALLAGKSDTGHGHPHDHDDSYYTEGETDALLEIWNSYRETQLNNGLAGKSDDPHTHPSLDEQDIWRLYKNDGSVVVAQTTTDEGLIVNKYVRANYFYSNNLQMALNTSVVLDVPADTGLHRGKIILGNNGENYFDGYMRYNSIVSFHTDAVFNNMGGSGVLFGTTGPNGFINLRMSDGRLSIENRWTDGGWVGWTVLLTSP